MYNEIYTSILHILTDSEEVNVNGNKTEMSTVLPLTTGAMITINRLRDIRLPGVIPIKLILADLPEVGMIYDDTVMVDGELTKVVVINQLAYDSTDIDTRIMSVLLPMRAMIGEVTSANINYLKKQDIGATNIVYYAPLIMGVRLINRLFNILDPVQILDYIKSLYITRKESITLDTIQSAIKVNDEYGIDKLLDNSYLLAAIGSTQYMNLFFADQKSDQIEGNEEDGETV